MGLVKLALLLILAVPAALAGLRALDIWRVSTAWSFLADKAEAEPKRFDPSMVEGLPEPAQRFFRFAIAPGTPLSSVAVFEMEGELGLGTKEDPKYGPMSARQVLAPPYGLVWRLKAGPIAGSDAALPDMSWTRFWLFGLIPVVRVSGDPDHHRSAFGRVVAEAAFWTPAALLPSSGVTWEPLGADSARATIAFQDFTQAVDITVNDEGAPVSVLIQRWSSANPDKTYRLQPFGGTLSDFREFGGYRVPTRVEGGNHFGTDAYFPFYKARITAMEFL